MGVEFCLIVYWLKSVVIISECTSDHNDTNKRHNCQNLIYALNVYLNDEYYGYFIDKLI